MSRIYYPPENAFEVEGNHLRITEGNVHKVSGTSMGGILGISPWSTPFTVACNLLGLCSEDISDKPAVKVGQALEEEIIRFADKSYPQFGHFYAAEQIFEKREGAHDKWVSDWEDEVFAGHLDGIVIAEDGQEYVLEIKTSANMESWEGGVPRYYQLQVMLYNHFMTKKDKAYVVLGAVNENTYKDYHSWIPNEKTVALYTLDIDQEGFAELLKSVKEWYEIYIKNGITPDYDPNNPIDVEMYNHLVSLAQDETKAAEMVSKLAEVTREIDNLEFDNKDKYDLQTELRTKLKDYMVAHNLSELKGGGAKVGISRTIRTSLDEAAMEKDGIDVSKYKIQKTVNSLRYKEE